MQQHTACLVGELDRRGVRQVVLTAFRPGAPRRERQGRHVEVLRVGAPVRRLRQLYSAPAGVLAARLAACADLVHAHLGEDLAMAPLALAAARARRVPLVLTLHMSVAHTLRPVDARTRALRAAGRPVERLATRRAEAVVALTERVRRLLVADGVDAARVHVVPSGVAALPERVADGDPWPGLGRPRALFVGRLAAQKGVSLLVDAAARLATPGAQLVLVGDGPQRSALERQVRRARLQDRVTFAGFVPRRALSGVLGHADVLVLPSRYEELGSVLLEGMQAGLPIVASAVGGIPEALGDAGVLVPAGNVGALADAIDAVLGDPARAARLGQLARAQAERYAWSRLAERVLGVYGQALAATSADVPPVPVAACAS
jgi:glycosyltransferase involved in cell wall biosynthesis